MPATAAIISQAYERVEGLLAGRRCVILDGGTATELNTVVPPPEGERDEPLWGAWALVHVPDAVLEVHRRYVNVGCDVISTHTWGLTGASQLERVRPRSLAEPVHWMDVARLGLRVGREAIARENRVGEVALAFSVNGDVDTPEKRETLQLLTRVLAEEPPDLILLCAVRGRRSSRAASRARRRRA